MISYGGILDEITQIFLSTLIVYLLYGNKLGKYALFPLAIPVIIDSDHLLPMYSEGIKAFHSAIFISLLAAPFLIYGLIKMNKKMVFTGSVAYVIAIFNISMDLLEGGGISFMYPLSDSRYVLESTPSQNISLAVLTIVAFSIMTTYVLRVYLDLGRKGTGFTGEPHIGHS